MNLLEAIAILDDTVPNPTLGLPDDIFYYISRTTPLINVDLLVKDEKQRTLLSWRDDRYCGKGWHIPGGIVRYKESLENRILKVAELELGTTISFINTPVEVNECIHDERVNRGHFISLLYKCFLNSSFIPDNSDLLKTDNGYLKWHDFCPPNLISCHEMYRKHINSYNKEK